MSPNRFVAIPVLLGVLVGSQAPALAARPRLTRDEKTFMKEVRGQLRWHPSASASSLGESMAARHGFTREQGRQLGGRVDRRKFWRGVATFGLASAITVGASAAAWNNGAWGTVADGGPPAAGVTIERQEQGSWINPFHNGDQRLVLSHADGRVETVDLHRGGGGKLSYAGVSLSPDGRQLSYLYTRDGGAAHLFTRTRNADGSWGGNVDQGPVRVIRVVPSFLGSEPLDPYLAR